MALKIRPLLLLSLILPGIAALISCQPEIPTAALPDYGTQSDSARYYFLKGWEEILDNGRWTESETAFRKALEFDPEWPLGQSLVGRITRDGAERIELLASIEANKAKTGPDERMLLDVNIQSLIASNNRDAGIPNTKEFNEARRALAEANFGAFARKYPSDNYFKAEYIEFLHANHGAQVALDSIVRLATEGQKRLGFYISYAASMSLELGNTGAAIRGLEDLKKALTDPSYLSPKVLQAQIWMAQDSMEQAADLMEEVVRADSNHLIAVGMLRTIKKKMEAQ